MYLVKNNINIVWSIGLVILISLSQTALAQRDSIRTIEDVNIVTLYKPNVAEANKIDILPTLKEPKYQPPIFNYSFPEIVFKPKPVYSPANAILLRPEKPVVLKDNYFRAGGGNYLTGIIDARYFANTGKNINYGIDFKHHSSNLSNNPAMGTFNRNRVNAFGERTTNATLRGDIFFDRNAVHYYGADTSRDFKKDTLKQAYNLAGATLSLLEAKKGKLATSLIGDVNFLNSNNASELSVSGRNITSFELPKTQKFTNLLAIAYNKVSRDTGINRIFVDLAPSYTFEINRLVVDLGIIVNYYGDNSTSKLYAAPNLRAETFLVPKKIKAFAAITGGLIQNTMQSFIYQNLFLNESFLLRNSMEKYRLILGMDGKLNKVFEYGLSISQNSIEDMAFFVNDTNDFRNLTTLYDDMNTFNFQGRVKFTLNNKINLGGQFNTYTYNLTSESQAWHMPKFDANIFFNFQVADKIYINSNFYHVGERFARDLANNTINIGGINDVSLAAEYRYKKNISFFGRVNNILNQRYALWNHHLSQGLNALAGFTITL